jgi:hypothetical protein
MKTGIRNSITALLLIPLVPTCFALLPSVQAAPDPASPPGNNTRDGAGAMAHITTGQGNSAFGTNALNKLTIGNNNAAQGNSALFSLTTGGGNVAVGAVALRLTTIGNQNTAVGSFALAAQGGSRNTALGYSALRSNTTNDNTAIGFRALASNTDGGENTAVGFQALASNTRVFDDVGKQNTAVGNEALSSNTTGIGNTATGDWALRDNISGNGNTATGNFALLSSTQGIGNTAIGFGALVETTGSFNIGLGGDAGTNLTTGSFNIDIGNPGVAGEANTTRIGATGSQIRTFIAGIRGVNQGSPAAVFINTTTGQLGTTPPSSSRRFKKEIKAMEQASASILSLKPVTFHYKSDSTGTPQFGLIAEEVAEVNPDLVVRDENGEIYTVRYEAVNAMLLNEFLKEHRTVQDLKSTVVKQEKQIEALTTGLRKVSNQLELNKPAQLTVGNNR